MRPPNYTKLQLLLRRTFNISNKPPASNASNNSNQIRRTPTTAINVDRSNSSSLRNKTIKLNQVKKIAELLAEELTNFNNNYTQRLNDLTNQFHEAETIKISSQISDLQNHIDQYLSFLTLNYLALVNFIEAFDAASKQARAHNINEINSVFLTEFHNTFDQLNKLKAANRDKTNVSVIGPQLISFIQSQAFYSDIKLAELYVDIICLIANNPKINAKLAANQFLCSYCKDVLVEPIILSCNHYYCKKCLEFMHEHPHSNNGNENVVENNETSINNHTSPAKNSPFLLRSASTMSPETANSPKSFNSCQNSANLARFFSCCIVCSKEQSLQPSHYTISIKLRQLLAKFYRNSANMAQFSINPAFFTPNRPIFHHSKSFAALKSAPPMIRNLAHTPENHENCNDDEEKLTEPFEANVEEALTASIYRLESLESLLLHHSQPGNFIIFDLDETLFCTAHYPALILSSFGVKQFHSYLKMAFPDFSNRNKLARALETALKEKKLIETGAPAVIRALQSSGCWIFAATARYSELENSTLATLQLLGIDFSRSAPFPSNFIKDPLTGAVCSQGIIYCGAQSKANCVSRFLANVTFAPILANLPQNLPNHANNYIQNSRENSENEEEISDAEENLNEIDPNSAILPPQPQFSTPIYSRRGSSRKTGPTPVETIEKSGIVKVLDYSGAIPGPNSTPTRPVLPPSLSLSLSSRKKSEISGLSSATSAQPSLSRTVSCTIAKKKRGNHREKRGKVKRSAIQAAVRALRHLLPNEIVFVDDLLTNINDIAMNFTVAKQLNLPLTCYCYSPKQFQLLPGVEKLQLPQKPSNSSANNQNHEEISSESNSLAKPASKLRVAASEFIPGQFSRFSEAPPQPIMPVGFNPEAKPAPNKPTQSEMNELARVEKEFLYELDAILLEQMKHFALTGMILSNAAAASKIKQQKQ
jgi:hypothetical protein